MVVASIKILAACAMLGGLIPGERTTLAETTWYVDDDCLPPGAGDADEPFCSIQAGVDAAASGDVVLVGPGTYTGDGNRDISLFGKAIVLQSAEGPSQTTIDIQGGPSDIHRGFFLAHGETQSTMIEGFTIENGYLVGDTGGSGVNGGGGGAGIYIRDSSPTIRNCRIRDNISASSDIPWVFDGMGGGIYVDTDSNAVIENCMIINNIAGAMGGGLRIYDENSNVTIRNCLVAGNFAGALGGGVYTIFATTNIINTTIADNHTTNAGGGLFKEGGTVSLHNSILWSNTADTGNQAFFDGSLSAVEFSLLEGGAQAVAGCCGWILEWGPGNIDSDPLFFDAANGDYHLRFGSPCIDAGDNLAVPADVVADLDGDPRFLDDPNTPDTGNPDGINPSIDMGAYEYDPSDCNNNNTLDVRELDAGATDCNGNAVPDDCEPDCNANGQADACDIVNGSSDDCDANGVPDDCDPDCNANGQPDACDIFDGASGDCDANLVPDECEQGPTISQQPADAAVKEGGFALFALQAEGTLLLYQWRKDGLDLFDTHRIIGSNSTTLGILDVQPTDEGAYDCVVVDFNELCSASSLANLTVIEPCLTDLNADSTTNAQDLALLLGAWGNDLDDPADLTCDGAVNAYDLAELLGNWGPC